jgi:hypothetical protein
MLKFLEGYKTKLAVAVAAAVAVIEAIGVLVPEFQPLSAEVTKILLTLAGALGVYGVADKVSRASLGHKV